MRLILLGIYAAGVLLSLVCFSYLEWWLALTLVAFLPLAALQMAEAKGIVQFRTVKAEPVELRAIDRAEILGLTDEQAAEKFGWQIVNDMDETIKVHETLLVEARKQRDGFAKLVKGEPQ